jgi:hypothetical protein
MKMAIRPAYNSLEDIVKTTQMVGVFLAKSDLVD